MNARSVDVRSDYLSIRYTEYVGNLFRKVLKNRFYQIYSKQNKATISQGFTKLRSFKSLLRDRGI